MCDGISGVAGGKYRPLGISITFCFNLMIRDGLTRRNGKKGCVLVWTSCPLYNEEHPKKVINAQHRFAKRRDEDEFKWKPSRKVEEAIVAAIFKSTVTTL